ncbi:MAG: hypothetical protein ACKVG0_11830 [Alphaproteobacteria bacterium]
MQKKQCCDATIDLEEWLLQSYILFNSIIYERIKQMNAATINAQASENAGVRFLRSFGQALNARDAFNELTVLSDADLAKRGLRRDQIIEQVVAKLG